MCSFLGERRLCCVNSRYLLIRNWLRNDSQLPSSRLQNTRRDTRISHWCQNKLTPSNACMAVDCTDAAIGEVSACKNCGNNPTLDLLECKAAGDNVYGVCDGHNTCRKIVDIESENCQRDYQSCKKDTYKGLCLAGKCEPGRLVSPCPVLPRSNTNHNNHIRTYSLNDYLLPYVQL